jgi:hypothetical protein
MARVVVSKPPKRPRQQASDQLWEGPAWVSGADLAQLMNKRPRKTRVTNKLADADDDADMKKPSRGARPRKAVAPTTRAADTVTGTEPEAEPKPEAGTGPETAETGRGPGPEPEPEAAETAETKRDSAPADPASAPTDEPPRKRDKDRIPSATVTVNGVTVPRPRTMECGMFFAYAPIPPKQEALLRWMLTSPTTAPDADFLRSELVPRLNRTHPVSLRLLDWFVVDYAQERDVAYTRYIAPLGRTTIVVVHKVYTMWRDRWRRRHYDPFRRRHRIYFDLDGATYSTTVAQLHFFSMARMFGFLDYAARHLESIDAHQRATITEARAGSGAGAGAQNDDDDDNDGATPCRRRPLVCKPQPRAFMSERTHTVSFGDDEEVDDDDEDEDDAAAAAAALLFPATDDA